MNLRSERLGLPCQLSRSHAINYRILMVAIETMERALTTVKAVQAYEG